MTASSRCLSFCRAIGQAFRLLISDPPAPVDPLPPAVVNYSCVTVVTHSCIADFRLAHKMHGIISRVAKEQSLSHNHVREVAHGQRTSARVLAALEQEYNRVNADQEREK